MSGGGRETVNGSAGSCKRQSRGNVCPSLTLTYGSSMTFPGKYLGYHRGSGLRARRDKEPQTERDVTPHFDYIFGNH